MVQWLRNHLDEFRSGLWFGISDRSKLNDPMIKSEFLDRMFRTGPRWSGSILNFWTGPITDRLKWSEIDRPLAELINKKNVWKYREYFKMHLCNRQVEYALSCDGNKGVKLIQSMGRRLSRKYSFGLETSLKRFRRSTVYEPLKTRKNCG